MLVKFVALSRFLIAMLFTFFATFPALADATCEATDDFYNKVAVKIIGILEGDSGLVNQVNNYNDHLKSAVFDKGAPCYIINMNVDREDNESYKWSGSDLKGTRQADKEYRKAIKKALKGMNTKNVNLDLSPYEFKTDSKISSLTIALKSPQTEEKRKKLNEDLANMQKCKAEIFNLSQEQGKIKNAIDQVSLYLTTLANPQTTTCTCDESGTLKACSTVPETGVPEEESSKDLSCKNLNEYSNDTAFCPTCVIFERVLLADQKLAGGAFGVLSGSLIKIVSLGFLIFVALQTLALVSSPASQPISKYLTSLVVQGFKVTVAVLILSNPGFLYDYALKPIIEGSLDFGLTLTGKSQGCIVSAGSKYTHFNTSDTLLSAPFLQKMVGAADCFNAQASIMPTIGRAEICSAFENLNWGVIPNVGALLQGIIVTIFGYLISLSIGFYLLDITLELGFLCCMLPFLVACWPFKITSRYTKIGWGIFMHVFFTFVMLGVVITTINAITKTALSSKKDVRELLSALNQNDLGFITDMMEIGGMQMLVLIVSCYICLKLLKDINNLANKFSGGAGFNISANVGGFVASAMVASAINGGRSLFGNISAGANALGKASGVNGAMNAAGQKVSKALGFDKMRELGMKGKGALGIGRGAVIYNGRQNNGNNTENNTQGNSPQSGNPTGDGKK